MTSSKFGNFDFSLKERLKKRWLYAISLLFIILIPIILIVSKGFSIEKTKMNSKIEINFGIIIVGIVYLIVFAKKIKENVAKMIPGIAKSIINGINTIIPFIILACFVYLIENALSKTTTTIWCIVLSMVIGVVIQCIDYGVNKRYLYEYELYRLARQDLDKEAYKQKLKEASNSEY